MTFGGVVNSDGTPNEEGLQKVFASFDLDSSGRLSKGEVYAYMHVYVNYTYVCAHVCVDMYMCG